MQRSSESSGTLLRVLGVIFGIAAVVGGMVGQGILRQPGIVAGAVHSPALILSLWLGGAVLAGITALAYVELGTAIPCAGGPFDFVRRAFGALPGIIAGWAGWLILTSAQAFMSTVVAEFLHRLGVWPGISTPVIAVGVLALFWALNWTSTRIAGDSQIVFSAAKGIGLIALVILLFAHPGSPAPMQEPVGDVVGIAAIAIAMRAIINTYAGWEDTVYHCEEIKRPERVLPRSMASGIVSVAILYLLVNAAVLHVLSPAQMAASNLPAADAAQVVFGSAGDVVLTAFGVLSVAAITNLNVMRSARVSFAMAREGYLPARLTLVAKSGTPRAALTVSVMIAAVIAASGTYETIIALSVAVTIALGIAVNAAAIRLRRVEPDLHRPFRIPLFPLPPLIAIGINAMLLAALIFEDPLHSLQGLGFVAVTGVIYWLLGATRQRSLSQSA
jgi:APA family basic amino acid/polyamine antiporter